MASKKKLKKYMVVFLENLSALIQGGYTAYGAVEMILEDMSSGKQTAETREVTKIANDIYNQNLESNTLGTAMRQSKYFFKYAALVESSVQAGKIPEVLASIAENIQEGNNLTGKIKSALIYPISVLSITAIAAVYMFTNIIPDLLETILDSDGGSIPVPTQIVMAMIDWMQKYGLAALVIVLAAIITLIFLAKGPLRVTANRLYLKIPVLGSVLTAREALSWMKAVQLELDAGSPIADTLFSAASSIGNAYLKQQADTAQSQVAEYGRSLSQALKGCSFISHSECALLQAGISSNTAVSTLEKMYQRKKAEAEKSISAFTAMLSPILICVVGVIVLLVMLAIYLPMIGLSDALLS